jgi:hypothetical protein
MLPVKGTNLNCAIATMQEFFENVLRYCRYFVTFTLGVFFALYQWVRPMFSSPLRLTALIGILIGLSGFIFFTLRAMLGLNPV